MTHIHLNEISNLTSNEENAKPAWASFLREKISWAPEPGDGIFCNNRVSQSFPSIPSCSAYLVPCQFPRDVQMKTGSLLGSWQCSHTNQWLRVCASGFHQCLTDISQRKLYRDEMSSLVSVGWLYSNWLLLSPSFRYYTLAQTNIAFLTIRLLALQIYKSK